MVPDGPCSEGYYCPGGQTSNTPAHLICPTGSFCPEGSHTHIVCHNGTYNHDSGQAECRMCPEGKFCDPFHENGMHLFVAYFFKVDNMFS